MLGSDIDVTTQPPDRMQVTATGVNRVNLFLYQTSLDAAWRSRFGELIAAHLATGGMVLAAVHDPLPGATRTLEIAP